VSFLTCRIDIRFSFERILYWNHLVVLLNSTGWSLWSVNFCPQFHPQRMTSSSLSISMILDWKYIGYDFASDNRVDRSRPKYYTTSHSRCFTCTYTVFCWISRRTSHVWRKASDSPCCHSSFSHYLGVFMGNHWNDSFCPNHCRYVFQQSRLSLKECMLVIKIFCEHIDHYIPRYVARILEGKLYMRNTKKRLPRRASKARKSKKVNQVASDCGIDSLGGPLRSDTDFRLSIGLDDKKE